MSLQVAVPFSLLLGSISAAFACITGYVLSVSGDYDTELLDDHMWAGIFITVLSFITYLISIKKIPLPFFQNPKTLIATILILFLFINITGHLGGSLTHGSDYISASFLWDEHKEKKKITNINDAFVFADLVHPILEDKCGNCHNGSRKKGKLSMANFASIAKGGKHGTGIKPGDPAESEIFKRVTLHPKDKKFMPADGKTPLTTEETAIIKWWIEKAAGTTDKKLAAVNPPEEIKKYVTAFFGVEGNDATENYTSINIQAPPVDKEVIKELKRFGFVIKFLHFKPDLLDVTLPSSDKTVNAAEKLKTLLQLKENIIWLNIAGNNVTDNGMETISQFKNLERLKLDQNPVTDKGIAKLDSLTNIKSLNLYNTKITRDCLVALSKLKSLKTVYVWGTGINKEDVSTYAPGLTIVTGR